MSIHHSIAIASVVSASAIALALTPGDNYDTDMQDSAYEYASTIRQTCTVCNETGVFAIASDSVTSYEPCPVCGGAGEIISAGFH